MSLESVQEDPALLQLDAEWMGLSAVRETFRIANREARPVSYVDALVAARELAPGLFDPAFSLISRGQEPPLVREYREKADARAQLDGSDITPVDLLDQDTAEYERLLSVLRRSRSELKRRLTKLVRAREWLDERVFSEHKLLERDVFTAYRPDLPNPNAKGKYIEYSLPNDRALRLRLLHPDKPEHTTGADLIYEFCDEERRVARFAFVQYKIWDTKALRFSSARNLASQMDRMANIVCRQGLCQCLEQEEPPENYRLPYCSAFLRPTDRLQRADAKLISSGLHVPVCVALAASPERFGGRVLRHDPIRSRAVSQRLFEELFQREMLGSRWLEYEEVEALYREHRVLEPEERITVYAQEYAVTQEA